MSLRRSVVMLEKMLPTDWNASLVGAKMVRSLASDRVDRRLVRCRAPMKAVRLEAVAAVMRDSGRERIESTMWMAPPLKAMSCGAA